MAHVTLVWSKLEKKERGEREKKKKKEEGEREEKKEGKSFWPQLPVFPSFSRDLHAKFDGTSLA